MRLLNLIARNVANHAMLLYMYTLPLGSMLSVINDL